MKKWVFLNLVIAATFILGACSTSNSVVSNKLISKRKYTKGFHINKKSKLKDSEETLAAAPVKEAKTESVNTKIKTDKDVKKNHEESTAASTENNYETEVYEESILASSSPSTGDELNFETEEGNDFVVDMEEETSQSASESNIESADNAAQPDMSDPVWLIIMILLALILPPVAIAIYSGITGIFWLDLILFIVGIGVGIGLRSGLGFGLAGICALAAVIIAFLVIFDVI